jgi:hypothetical protein
MVQKHRNSEKREIDLRILTQQYFPHLDISTKQLNRVGILICPPLVMLNSFEAFFGDIKNSYFLEINCLDSRYLRIISYTDMCLICHALREEQAMNQSDRRASWNLTLEKPHFSPAVKP